MTIEPETICDVCGQAVSPAELDDCTPDDLGFCILCGKQIGDVE